MEVSKASVIYIYIDEKNVETISYACNHGFKNQTKPAGLTNWTENRSLVQSEKKNPINNQLKPIKNWVKPRIGHKSDFFPSPDFKTILATRYIKMKRTNKNLLGKNKEAWKK